MKLVQPKIYEREIQKQIMDYLKMKRVLFIRNQSGALVTDKRFVKFGSKGSPDILAFHKGIAYAIEVKTSMVDYFTPVTI